MNLRDTDLEGLDLHLFEDGACRPGMKYAVGRNRTLERLVSELVIPFFYRLSYTDRYGSRVANPIRLDWEADTGKTWIVATALDGHRLVTTNGRILGWSGPLSRIRADP